MVGCVEKIGKNPIAVRVVTNVVLMISDADVIFSFLFMANLYEFAQKDELYQFFFVVVFAGILMYALGALVLAPRQKFVTAKLVLRFMVDNPTECISKTWYKHGHGEYTEVEVGSTVPEGREVTISKELQVYPNPPPRTRNPPIGQLNLSDQKDRETLKNGLGQWGLGAVWDSVERKNARNCAEVKHGVPFYRLARFGFMSQPTPRDLGSILNINALYSFTTGIPQLIFSIFILLRKTSSEEDMSMSELLMLTIPLSISFLSLVLSIFNVIFDFAGKLSESEGEIRMSDAILQKHEVQLDNAKAKLKQDHQKAIQDIEEKYRRMDGEKPGEHALEKKTEMQRLTDQYSMDFEALDEGSLKILDIELTGYRKKRNRIRTILVGGTHMGNESTGIEFQDAKELQDAHEMMVHQIKQSHIEKIGELSARIGDMTSEQYRAEKDRLIADYEAKLQVASESRRNTRTDRLAEGTGDGTGVWGCGSNDFDWHGGSDCGDCGGHPAPGPPVSTFGRGTNDLGGRGGFNDLAGGGGGQNNPGGGHHSNDLREWRDSNGGGLEQFSLGSSNYPVWHGDPACHAGGQCTSAPARATPATTESDNLLDLVT